MIFDFNIDGFEFGKHSMLFRITASREKEWDTDGKHGRLIIYLDFLNDNLKEAFEFTADGFFSQAFCDSLKEEEMIFIRESLWTFFNEANFAYSKDSSQKKEKS